ncbi:AI-2E family transporter, partial [Bacillus cereus group sp. BceL245]|uniref:AI-2E family transporter n=1 Tax=Bacillus cereus group sp. BceL245 TaxID=3444998 RepID=UPI0040421280
MFKENPNCLSNFPISFIIQLENSFPIPLAFAFIFAYNVGGVMYVVYILVFITVIHALESYFLNPKFMSAKTNLPIFYTFMILIFSEHFLGIWGLIIGIPIFIFLLDVLDINNEDATKK